MAVAPKTVERHLPRFPSPKELELTHDAKVRVGSPDFQISERVPSPYGSVAPVPVEYYINRYNEVLAGVPVRWLTVDDFLIGFSFEIVLADLYACRNCDNKSESFRPCRTSRGQGYYLDFDRAAYRLMCEAREKDDEAPRPLPRFTMRQCPGQAQRIHELAAFYKAVTYR